MAIPLVIGAIQAGAALAKGIAGARQASKAKKALKNFQRQELKNITEGMRVSTLGAELQTQEAQRRFSTSVEALRSGGVRGLVGGLGQQEQLQQRQQQQIAADIDQQQRQIEVMRAQDEARIQGMQEKRDEFEIGRLMGEQAAGRQQLTSAIGDFASAATAFIPQAGEGRAKDLTTLDTSMRTDNFVAEKKGSGFLGLGPKQLQFTKNNDGSLGVLKGYTTGKLSDQVSAFQTTGPSVSSFTIPPFN